MVRVELKLTEEQAEMLDRIAEQVGKALAPQHIARSGHPYDRKAAILFLMETYEPTRILSTGVYTENPNAGRDSLCDNQW
jgi:hypothetical protein